MNFVFRNKDVPEKTVFIVTANCFIKKSLVYLILKHNLSLCFDFILQGRNKSGQIGYFPESYVETESTAIQPSSAASPTNSCTDGPFSGSSVNSQNINKTPATEFCKLAIIVFLCSMIFKIIFYTL